MAEADLDGVVIIAEAAIVNIALYQEADRVSISMATRTLRMAEDLVAAVQREGRQT